MIYRKRFKTGHISIKQERRRIEESDRWLARQAEGKFIYRDDKPSRCYHHKTPEGTVCKMENGVFYRKLNAVSNVSPPGRELCSMCQAIQERDNYPIPWERLDTW